MQVANAARHLARGLMALSLGLAAAAHAQTMVSISGNTVNMREEPSLNSTVLWELQRGYPLEVTERRGDWLAVKDFEDDTGWVSRALTSNDPHVVVKGKVLNLRSQPNTRSDVVTQLSYGELLKTVEKRGEWMRVERTAGGETGWVARHLVWGY